MQVHELASVEQPGIGIATVYRAIRRMLDANDLTEVFIPGEVMYYELNGGGHHHYFHCNQCSFVFVIDGCPSAIPLLTPPGFLTERHDLVLHGCCERCARRQSQKAALRPKRRSHER